MAFTVSDFQDLLRLLRQHPEWKADLRPLILGDELLAMPDAIDRLTARIDAVIEEMRTDRERTDALRRRASRAGRTLRPPHRGDARRP